MNIGLSDLSPGVFGVSHGGGLAGEIIRHATGSWAGHAFLYLGNGQLVEGAPPAARIIPADSYSDAIWAYRMWDRLESQDSWPSVAVTTAQGAVTARGRALVGRPYDWAAYAGFALEVLKIRDQEQLDPAFANDTWRVCSALVADALTFGGVPLKFVPEDGPGLEKTPDARAAMLPNLVAPGMLLGLAQRLDWC